MITDLLHFSSCLIIQLLVMTMDMNMNILMKRKGRIEAGRQGFPIGKEDLFYFHYLYSSSDYRHSLSFSSNG